MTLKPSRGRSWSCSNECDRGVARAHDQRPPGLLGCDQLADVLTDKLAHQHESHRSQ